MLAQDHVVTSSDLQKDIAGASAIRQNNLKHVDDFISSPSAQQAIKSAHIDYEHVKNGVSQLSNDDLARLSARSEKAQKDFAAGSLSDRDLLLIIVGVMLDTMRQVETHLIQRHYDGFLRKGRVRGGFTGRSAYVRGEAAAQRTLMWLYVGIAIIVIGGVAAFLASK